MRGRGLARLVVGGALERAAGLGPEPAIVFCRPDEAGLYAALDRREITGPVEVEQPGGPVVMPLLTRWHPLRDGAGRPAGAVWLHALPI
ncbi:hypothetical protein ACIRBX_04450 [Kitasatospora sp. NPDC096147]|uniref:hypothetical protein n=1 Tax=Kitasatospora sp. NPDC096147 TaxID=3364093 RepID=UPI0038181CD7